MDVADADRKIGLLERRYYELNLAARTTRVQLRELEAKANTVVSAVRLTLRNGLTGAEREMASILEEIGRIEDSLLD